MTAPESITHPAGRHSVADILTQSIRQRVPGWAEETDETTWQASTDPDEDGWNQRWVIVATGQIAPRNPGKSRPGPLIVAGAGGIETRIQLPYVVGQDQIIATLEALVTLGAIPNELEETS